MTDYNKDITYVLIQSMILSSFQIETSVLKRYVLLGHNEFFLER